jgi:hypothetical protein
LHVLVLALALTWAAPPTFGQQDVCDKFRLAVKTTYDFKPSLLSESDQSTKSAAMDNLWEMVKANSQELLPCLRAALADPKSDPWFRFDGSNLLVSLDSSREAKAEQVRQYAAVDLNDVHQGFWVGVLARRAAEGFDVSEAGARWLAFPKAEYTLPQHGGYVVNSLLGAFFIYGSMDEKLATPALLKIATDAGNPARERALALLLFQVTPEAFQAVRVANRVGRTDKEQAELVRVLGDPPRVQPRDQPKTTRDEFLKAFNGYVNGDEEPFLALVSKVGDGERDVVAVLKQEDVPLIRRVRRKIIANANQHAFEFYKTFTDILMTLVWRPELVK